MSTNTYAAEVNLTIEADTKEEAGRVLHEILEGTNPQYGTVSGWALGASKPGGGVSVTMTDYPVGWHSAEMLRSDDLELVAA